MGTWILNGFFPLTPSVHPACSLSNGGSHSPCGQVSLLTGVLEALGAGQPASVGVVVAVVERAL